MWLEDGIIFSEFWENTHITLENARMGVQERLEFMHDISRPVLSDIRNVSGIDSDARDYYATAEALRNMTAVGIVTGNKFTKLYANFFLKFSKPVIPTFVFSNVAAGLRWLEQYK